jgi:hypothetical protein
MLATGNGALTPGNPETGADRADYLRMPAWQGFRCQRDSEMLQVTDKSPGFSAIGIILIAILKHSSIILVNDRWEVNHEIPEYSWQL